MYSYPETETVDNPNPLLSRGFAARDGDTGRVEFPPPFEATAMAITATISVPFTSPSRRTLASVNSLSPRSTRSTLPTPQRTFKYPNSRLVVSSMSTETAVKTSSASFLNRKESGFLHFAKYHGLGNDFVLVSPRSASLFPFRINNGSLLTRDFLID